MLKKTLSLAVTLLMTACTQASLAVVNLPSHFDDSQVTSDIAYGPDTLQKLDIYAPEQIGHEKRDVIVFLYGGRWTFGSKHDYKFIGTTFANHGFVTVIPDYRKYPQIRFPVFVEDSAKALAWVYDHIDDYGGKTNHIYVIGHSAGAHMGALLATDQHYLAAEGKKTKTVMRGFIGLAGPYAFTPDEPDLEDMFGPPDNYRNMMATTFVDGNQPPMLLLHGTQDTDVKSKNLELLTQAIHEKGGEVKSILYPATDHISIVKDLTWIGNDDAPVLKDILEYINAMDQENHN